ncbi:MAG: ABC transporter permease [Phycisphaerales bacterium]|nr:ABC transporter permease [Phycisphaerales bacterium]
MALSGQSKERSRDNSGSEPESISAIRAPSRQRDNPLTRSVAGMLGMGVLIVMFIACLGSLPWTLSSASDKNNQTIGVPRYDAGSPKSGRLPPFWWSYDEQDIKRSTGAIEPTELETIALEQGVSVDDLLSTTSGPLLDEVQPRWPTFWFGSDMLGRSLGTRLLAGGGISLTIGLAAALISVGIGTIYGALAAYIGGKVDSFMMRVVDVLYGLPYILLVVLLAVASNAMVDEWVTHNKAKERWIQKQVVESHSQSMDGEFTRSDARELLAADIELHGQWMDQAVLKYPRRELSAGTRTSLDVLTLLIAIGGVSWLTMARVIRGQVLSLKNQQFVEAARAIGSSPTRIFVRHLLPNLIGPIVVYATLAVPQAILQESFLSFLGIGVKPPLPSWGNLAAEGLGELNTYRSHWWLLFFPCLLLGITLLAMNFVGEGLREAFDPKRQR